ncbi:unnamed protein product [Enterobius vermicularis]|uniref:Glycosyltransferase family 92 protein n=1 Tax=Enterobius vermicularis TaxID=51028 RepID=A0A0N4VJV7_ENTVE|nr:unnamed protein product [Enterobius vermicularis]
MWINHGATKFIFYQQTVSKEVDALIRMYEHDKTIEIERVPWGTIPLSENTTEEEDPNKEIFRAEQVMVWNDCILRSRGKTEYLALADFDEHTYLKATNPTEIRFDDHYKFDVESKVYPKGLMSKAVVIPERVESQIVHETLRMEKPFKEHIVNPKTARLLHLRLQPMKHSMSGLYISTTEVAKYIPAWSRRYKKILNDEIERLKNLTSLAELTLKTKRWKNNGHEVMKETDSCFEALRSEEKVCPTQYRCLAHLQTMKYDEWVNGGSSWVAL